MSEAYRCLLDLTSGSLAGAEDEAGDLCRRACGSSVSWASFRFPVMLDNMYTQLCGLVGNFSLEMSWRDMVAGWD